jgi:regulator of sirC expression with transglutaminase-like and TPR domain
VRLRLTRILSAPALAGALILAAGCSGAWPDYDPYAQLASCRQRKGRSATSIDEVMALPEREIDLGRAALLVAAELSAGKDVAAELVKFERLVKDAARQIGRGGNARDALDELNNLLLVGRGVGYHQASSAPDFDISEVLTRQRGNCLNCTMLYLAVAQRLELKLHAVVIPGHIFMRYDDGKHSFNLEPTLGGKRLTDLRYMLISDIPKHSLQRGVYLRSLSPREFLAEVLAARGGLLARSGKLKRAGRDLELALSVLPASVQALVNSGYLAERSGRRAQARTFYRRVLALDSKNAVALNNLSGLLVADPAAHDYDPLEARKLISAALRGRRRASPQQRAAVLDTAARIAAVQADWRDAVRYARGAVKLAPSRDDYRTALEKYERKRAASRKARRGAAAKGKDEARKQP